MDKSTLTVDGRELMSSITLRVRMPRALGLRLWLACKLFHLAGWVSGTTVTVEMEDQDPSVFSLPAGYTFTPLCEHDDPNGAVHNQKDADAVKDQA